MARMSTKSNSPAKTPSSAGPTPKALAGLETIREELRKADGDFAAAEAAVRDAVAFCMSVRGELRRRRNKLALDQSQVGQKLNLSQSAVSKIENGRGDIGLLTVYEYADAVGLRPVVSFVPNVQAAAGLPSGASAGGEAYVVPAGAIEAVVRALIKSVPKIGEALVATKPPVHRK
jgi:transcriptional regulator with XRE-family HTH domain